MWSVADVKVPNGCKQPTDMFCIPAGPKGKKAGNNDVDIDNILCTCCKKYAYFVFKQHGAIVLCSFCKEKGKKKYHLCRK